MSTKHTVTDSRGNVHTRTSLGRVYSHAIVSHWTRQAKPGEVYTRCEYASRADLAEKAAAGARKSSSCIGVEIIETTREEVRR